MPQRGNGLTAGIASQGAAVFAAAPGWQAGAGPWDSRPPGLPVRARRGQSVIKGEKTYHG
jgi:hypothetical protein